MIKKYKVIWAPVAAQDLRQIISFIHQENPFNAKSVLNKIKRQTNKLSRFPLRGRSMPELKKQGIVQYRELMIFPWRLVYRIVASQVFVVGCLDSRRNLEDLLLMRFLAQQDL